MTITTIATGRGAPARQRYALAIAAFLVAALAGCAWLDAKQRQLALRPTPTQPTDVARLQPGDARFTVPVAAASGDGNDKLALWWLPNSDPGAPTLLYLHGTFRNLYYNQPKIFALRDAGFSIVAVDYRGWGDSTSIVPSEETITADAWRAWKEVVRRQPVARKRVIFGHSLGTAVAVSLACTLHAGSDYGALILESAFTSLPDVAAADGFWGTVGAAVTNLEFDSLSKIGKVDAPVLMLHGSADHTVPVELGRKLRDAGPPGTRWIEVPGGSHSGLHDDAPALYRKAMRELINSLGSPGAGPAADATPGKTR